MQAREAADIIAKSISFTRSTKLWGVSLAFTISVYNQKDDVLEGGCDRRPADGAAVAQPVR